MQMLSAFQLSACKWWLNILVDKYRPTSFEQLIGNEDAKARIQNVLKSNEKPPHFLFAGPPGCGKDSTAQIVARMRFGDSWEQQFVELNASDERGIDTVRNKIKNIVHSEGQRILYLNDTSFASDPCGSDILAFCSRFTISLRMQPDILAIALERNCTSSRWELFCV